jgi:hypothetical protein
LRSDPHRGKEVPTCSHCRPVSLQCLPCSFVGTVVFDSVLQALLDRDCSTLTPSVVDVQQDGRRVVVAVDLAIQKLITTTASSRVFWRVNDIRCHSRYSLTTRAAKVLLPDSSMGLQHLFLLSSSRAETRRKRDRVIGTLLLE